MNLLGNPSVPTIYFLVALKILERRVLYTEKFGGGSETEFLSMRVKKWGQAGFSARQSLTKEIVEDLEAALEQFREIAAEKDQMRIET